jgi:hypothetical protein
MRGNSEKTRSESLTAQLSDGQFFESLVFLIE